MFFQKKQIPDDIEVITVKKDNLDIAEILVNNNIIKSKNEFRRLISQGGVKLNDKRILDLSEIDLENNPVLQIGKKKFVKIELK